jgi:dTDP-4-dehydrorhamnose reductase
MTILLLGGSGQVGWELARTLAPLGALTAPGRAQADLAQPETLRPLVRGLRPSLIVNAAAYTAVDQAAKEPELARTVNGIAPGVLAEEAQRLGIPLVHYSTDYVFDGRKADAYLEGDPTGPLNVYGRSKLAGEQAIAATRAAHLIFRTSWVYGARGKNFLRTLLRLARERDRLTVVDDQIGAPTWCRMIAEATALALIQHRRADGRFDLAEVSGLYHLAAAGATSWHGFAEAILALDPQRAQHRARRVDPISTAQYAAPEARPANSRLDASRVRSVFGLALPDWRASLQQVMAEVDPSP